MLQFDGHCLLIAFLSCSFGIDTLFYKKVSGNLGWDGWDHPIHPIRDSRKLSWDGDDDDVGMDADGDKSI